MPTTCISLIERLGKPQPRDEDWTRFAELYTPLLMFWAEKRAGLTRVEAEDLVQEVMILLMARLPEFSYREGGSFRGWLRTVTLNLGRDYLRGKRRRDLQVGPDQVRGVAVDAEVEFLTDREYSVHLAHRALELMKVEFENTTWQACWKHVVENRSAREIALELGISENAVYLAKSRVLRRVREELGPIWEA